MAHDSMLIQIRERSFLDLLDLTLVVIKQRAWPIGIAALSGVLPFAILNAYLASQLEISPSLGLFLVAFEAPWATAPLTVVLGLLMFGDHVSVRVVIRSLIRSLPALILTQFFLRSILFVSFFLIVLIPTLLNFLNEVILLERGKVRSIFRRCSILSKENQGDYFGQWIAKFFFGILFITSFWIGSNAFVSSLLTPELTWERPESGDLLDFRFQLILWFTIVFFNITRFLGYIDRRIRLEGWEVKLRIQKVGKAMEGEERW